MEKEEEAGGGDGHSWAEAVVVIMPNIAVAATTAAAAVPHETMVDEGAMLQGIAENDVNLSKAKSGDGMTYAGEDQKKKKGRVDWELKKSPGACSKAIVCWQKKVYMAFVGVEPRIDAR